MCLLWVFKAPLLPFAALKCPWVDECPKVTKWINSWTGGRAWGQAVMLRVHPQQWRDSCQTALCEHQVHWSVGILLPGTTGGKNFLTLCLLRWTTTLPKGKEQDGGEDRQHSPPSKREIELRRKISLQCWGITAQRALPPRNCAKAVRTHHTKW